jgi:hypothetical protein
MATICGPKGRMTKPLVTPFAVGDVVTLTADLDDGNDAGPFPHVGDVGVIRRIYISAPGDGDDTFLMFDVHWAGFGQVYPVGNVGTAVQFAPADQSRYIARLAAKKLAGRIRDLATGGADLGPLESAVETITAKTASDTAWLRQQLNRLNERGGS